MDYLYDERDKLREKQRIESKRKFVKVKKKIDKLSAKNRVVKLK